MDLLQDARDVRSKLAPKENDMEKEVKHGEEFVKYMMKLNAEELCALSKFLGVRLLTDKINPDTKKAVPRDGLEIIDDCIAHYAELGRTDRRWLLRYLKKTVKARG
jgi:hypothetical protein